MDHIRQVQQTYDVVLVCSVMSIAPALGAVRVLAWWRRRHGIPRVLAMRRSVAEVVSVVGTVPWLVMTMWPDHNGYRHASLRPLHDLLSAHPSSLFVQVVGNLLVFAAAGFFLPIRFRALASVMRVMALAAACSVVIEILQYVLDIGRVSSVDDVLINTVGAGIAAALSSHWWRQPRQLGSTERRTPSSI